ncbi:hypothetical protein BGZ72_010466 [Mortierella alpina]|nr:hypothetical protein BGZ72_010466 [Mortierella alpina]
MITTHQIRAAPPTTGVDEDAVTQPLGVHESIRAKNWLKVSGLVNLSAPSYLKSCARCGVVRNPRYGAQAHELASTRHECSTKPVNGDAIKPLEAWGGNAEKLIKYSQWSKYFRTACAKEASVCRADEASTIFEWTSRNGDDYLCKDKWAERMEPWRVIRGSMKDGWLAIRELYEAMFRTMAVMCEDACDVGPREVKHCVCLQFITGGFKEGAEGSGRPLSKAGRDGRYED